jgi:hypothetical protein
MTDSRHRRLSSLFRGKDNFTELPETDVPQMESNVAQSNPNSVTGEFGTLSLRDRQSNGSEGAPNRFKSSSQPSLAPEIALVSEVQCTESFSKMEKIFFAAFF